MDSIKEDKYTKIKTKEYSSFSFNNFESHIIKTIHIYFFLKNKNKNILHGKHKKVSLRGRH